MVTPTNTTQEYFTEFFDLGQDESVSPFIIPKSRNWSINLTLKAAIAATLILFFSFICSFFPSLISLGRLFLVFVYFLVGIPSLIEAVEDLTDGQINIDILMTLAAFSSILIGSGMEGGLLLVLFALSGAMEDAVTAKAKNALSSLHKLSPTKACVIQQDGTLIDKAIKEISIGTSILVKSGQVVPLDGTIIHGISSVNLVHLTGENFPITKSVGDPVPAGARNLEGALTIKVTQTSADSTLNKIIELVTQAQESRPILQRWFDRFSQTYATTIIILSALFALSLPYFLNISFFGNEGSLYRSLAFLIAASPCALIIAIPIAYLSAISVCARHGVLLKGGVILDALARCQMIAFDKTGTLTTGELSCIDIETLTENSKISIKEALAVAYAMEKNIVHPIAKAMIIFAEKQKAQILPLTNFKSIPGYGVEAIVQLQNRSYNAYMGHAKYIAEKLSSVEQEDLFKHTKKAEENGELIAILTLDNHLFLFRFRDTPRKNISPMLAAIKKRGMHTIMLTGDHIESATKIAKELNIDQFYAALTPHDKLQHIAELSKKNDLAMIGDGINDAPALARATVGICMGKVGSATAVDAADIVLLQDNIELLDWIIGKAKKTQIIVKQNLIVAIAAIIMASLPALGGFVPLWLAVILHEGGTVLVGLNALRLFKD